MASSRKKLVAEEGRSKNSDNKILLLTNKLIIFQKFNQIGMKCPLSSLLKIPKPFSNFLSILLSEESFHLF